MRDKPVGRPCCVRFRRHARRAVEAVPVGAAHHGRRRFPAPLSLPPSDDPARDSGAGVRPRRRAAAAMRRFSAGARRREVGEWLMRYGVAQEAAISTTRLAQLDRSDPPRVEPRSSGSFTASPAVGCVAGLLPSVRRAGATGKKRAADARRRSGDFRRDFAGDRGQ